ncbi:MAG: histone-lysine N-methyltransferase [Parcubacteria group bacterium Gr01-1014_48]|nr:MAG: histone-lysine N-methyltransferase [Parcubacteria group bacterium Gr01-1014_48]TSD00878.1 MAG: histone-lysine N-methyltransferase [Parcubacteria group bacterium Greene1014_15]TSD08181.1 MAG: histone-lysine N-methyltransferase [Parcubacteria group bacterium Greene0714_4]
MNYAKIQRNLRVRKSKTGLGLFTQSPLKRGDFVIEYTGKLLSREKADDKGGRYLFDISNRRAVDGTNRKNVARYINHACRPNCEVDIRRGRIFVFACRKIKVGEELNYDYGKEYWDEYIKPRGCLCEKCQDSQ